MHSLDMPHHLRANEWCRYREGVTLAGPDGADTLVECGLPVKARIDVHIPADTRVTVDFGTDVEPSYGSSPLPAVAVSPHTPRERAGYYWGYSTRKASCLSAVFTEAPWKGGYDVSVGTSERGVSVTDLLTTEPGLPAEWQHLILVFGGVAGLEVALAADPELAHVGEVGEVFDHWVNLVPQQGSRTIRTEEAVWLGLMGFRDATARRSASSA
jgi:predicted SPOUT superfamily RNA methylase MTH1